MLYKEKLCCCRFHHNICISLICFELWLGSIVKTLSLANVFDCFAFGNCICLAKFKFIFFYCLSNTSAAAFPVMYVQAAARDSFTPYLSKMPSLHFFTGLRRHEEENFTHIRIILSLLPMQKDLTFRCIFWNDLSSRMCISSDSFRWEQIVIKYFQSYKC